MPHARVVFMGTPEYAVPALEMLAQQPAVRVELVVTQPDRPQGRGRRLQSPPVKLAADRLGIRTVQLASLRPAEHRQSLAEIAPDLIVVAAFGLILGAKTLAIPRLGCVNLHASLLPKYRGANPIAAAIAMGERETGVSLMQMDRGLDTGPVLAMRSEAIDASDTTASLTSRLAQSGARLLQDNLDGLLAGTLAAHPQGIGGSLTRPMTKDDGWIDWTRPAAVIERHVRAMDPWPRAWSTFEDGTRIQVLKASVSETTGDIRAGVVHVSRNDVMVATGAGMLKLEAIQLPGGKPTNGRAIADRLHAQDGCRLGQTDHPVRLPLVVRL